MKLIQGDCIEEMRKLEACSVDTVITDPPYGLEFMGKEWDSPWKGKASKPFSEIPEGSMGGFRSLPQYNRTNNIKCLACDKWKFSSNPCVCENPNFPNVKLQSMVIFQEWTRLWATEALRVAKPGAVMLCFGGTRTVHRIACGIEDAGWEVRDTMMWLYGSGFPKSYNIQKGMAKANLLEGAYWEGYGTALKPAFEPIIVCVKPLDGTYVENALKHGVAGLNIDGGRVPTEDTVTINTWDNGAKPFGDGAGNPYSGREETGGRWPASLIHDGSEEVLAGFPQTKSSIFDAKKPNNPETSWKMTSQDYPPPGGFDDSGSAARFFYCAKASKSERNAGLEEMEEGQTHRLGAGIGEGKTPDAPVIERNTHPTVKPLSLMTYLCRLTKTPTGGVVLDPFMGSGTTGMACKVTGREFIGIELDEHYFEISEKRINSPIQQELI